MDEPVCTDEDIYCPGNKAKLHFEATHGKDSQAVQTHSKLLMRYKMTKDKLV